jgi:hypothetical protein
MTPISTSIAFTFSRSRCTNGAALTFVGSPTSSALKPTLKPVAISEVQGALDELRRNGLVMGR